MCFSLTILHLKFQCFLVFLFKGDIIHCFFSFDIVTSRPSFHLTGGSDQYEGRLEVYFLGQWGNICLVDPNEQYYIIRAHAICSYLEVPPLAQHSMVPVSNTSFGSASADSPVWLVNVGDPSLRRSRTVHYKRPAIDVEQWGYDTSSSSYVCGREMDAAVICNSKYFDNNLDILMNIILTLIKQTWEWALGTQLWK